MGLSASMFTGISGLLAHGERMAVLGNNIANVNTVGYKGQRMHFEDFISQDIATSAGTAQVGRGVRVEAILSDFSQGSFETTNESTDLAIGGRGFFLVKPKDEDVEYYTRAGNFRFDKEGYLVDPHGMVLQGEEVTRDEDTTASTTQITSSSERIRTTGVLEDIQLENFSIQPQETQLVTMVFNLDSEEPDRSTSTTNPYFAMFENWNASNAVPLGETQYSFQYTMTVYDDNGVAHDLTTYFDQANLGSNSGKKVWEYMVTIDPDEDNRVINGSALAGTSNAGVLMIGTLTFSAGGQLEDMSAFILSNGATGTSLDQWTAAPFSSQGYALVAANFLDEHDATESESTPDTADHTMQINFGLSNGDLTGGGWTGAVAADTIGTTFANLPTLNDPQSATLSSTSYADNSTILFQSQDGYTSGLLQSLSVDRDGVLSGRFSNGEVLELYLIKLADFLNETGLRREGNNLYTETRQSGQALFRRPNQEGVGSISSNSLEQSNIDLAREFVDMIITQRGFQANSKVITTTDQMLQELIMLKR